MEGAFQRLTVKHDPWQLCSSHCVQQPGYLSRSLTGPNWWMVNRPLLGMRQAEKWSPTMLRGSAESERQRPLPSMSSCSWCLRKASEPFVFVNCGLKCFSGRPKRGMRHTSPRNGFFLHHSCQVGSRYNEVIIHSGNSCHGFLGSLTQALCIWGSQLAPGSSKQSASVNEGIIQEWPSKPGQEHSLTDYRNGSAYLCDKRLFNRVPADDRPDCTENIIAESSRRVLPPTCWKAPAFSVNVSKEFHKWAWGKQHWDSLPVSTPSGPQMTRANANKPEQDGG